MRTLLLSLAVALAVSTGCGACAYDPPPLSVDARQVDAITTDAVMADADVDAPSVVSITPTDNAEDVSTTTAIIAVFDEPVDPGTVTASTFRLDGPSGAVAGSFIFDGSTVSLAPQARLDPSVTYTVTITTGVQDRAGNALTAEGATTFATRQGGWSDPTLLEDDEDLQVTYFDAAIRGGRAVAAWTASTCSGQLCGSPYEVWSAVYEAGTWSPPERVASAVSGIVGQVRVAIDAAGNATATWIQPTGSYSSVLSSHRPAGGVWTAPAAIETEELGHAGSLRVGTNGDGHSVAVWDQNDGTNTNVWANRSNGSTWGTATKLEAASGTAADPDVAVADDGSALVVWTQNSNVYYSHFASGTWSSAALVGGVTGNAGTGAPVLRVDATGGVMALWISAYDLKAARFNGAWSTPETIDAIDAAIAAEFALATASNGKAAAIWSQGSTSTRNLYKAEFDGSSWSNASLLEQFSGNSGSPTLAYGDGDRAMVAWAQGATVVGWTAERRPGSGWQAPESMLDAVPGILLYDSTRNVFINVWAQSVVGFKSMYWASYQ